MFSFFRKRIFPISLNHLEDIKKRNLILKKLEGRAEDIQYSAERHNIPLTETNNETLYLQLIRILVKKIERNDSFTNDEISILNGMFESHNIGIEIATIEDLRKAKSADYVLPRGKENYFFLENYGYVRLHIINRGLTKHRGSGGYFFGGEGKIELYKDS